MSRAPSASHQRPQSNRGRRDDSENPLGAILASQLQQDAHAHHTPHAHAHMEDREAPGAEAAPHEAGSSTNNNDGSNNAAAANDTPNAKGTAPTSGGSSKSYSAAATPTSEYALPQSARSGSFPEYGQATRYPGGHPMTQTPTSSVAQSSPTYPPPGYGPYSTPHHELPAYATQQAMYRPDWATHYAPVYQHPSSAGAPNMTARPPGGGHPLSTVYSFVPIPGAQQHKRPRRRYEEIERMYKCGWNGCEKAYGTLNHLNAHVTMQSHGAKRTPDEFKEIRKEWKAKKKEEDNQRKQDEERARQEAGRTGADQGSQTSGFGGSHMMQAPPMGYQAAGTGQPQQYGGPQTVDASSSTSQYSGQMYGSQPYPQTSYTQQYRSGA